MLIREMSREECLSVLARNKLARLGCSHENQPYVVPVSLACYGLQSASPCFYGFTTQGQKVEWMRTNPLVCVEIDEHVAHDQWVSIIVFGRYVELPEVPGRNDTSYQAPERLMHSDGPIPVLSSNDVRQVTEDEDRINEWDRAWQVLKANPSWWETGWTAWVARPRHTPSEAYKIVYYKIWIDRITGHVATRNFKDELTNSALTTPTGRWAWVRKLLSCCTASSSANVMQPVVAGSQVS